jgi:hypothetical protein
MSDREDFLNSMSPDTGPTDAPEPQEAPDVIVPNESGDGDTPAAASPTEVDPLASTKSFLDSLTNPDPNAAPAAAPVPAAAGAPSDQPGTPAAAAPGTPPADAAQKTPEQEEAELLEGVKSERGKERIREKLAELRTTSEELDATKSDLTEFRTMVLEAYQDPNDFARALEFGRLVAAGDDNSLSTALAMLDEQRNAIALRLGVDVAGVDQLADFPELKQAVDNMEITREYAVKLAKGQRQERMQTQQRQAAQQQQQEVEQSRREYEAQITGLTDQATKYFSTRAHEVDYAAKMEAIKAHFSKPGEIEKFVQTFQPNQWLAQFQFMYDNVRTAPAARASAHQQPLRARSVMSGAPATNPNASSVDRMASILDGMGI